jgi:hypothetical protein
MAKALKVTRVGLGEWALWTVMRWRRDCGELGVSHELLLKKVKGLDLREALA